VRRRDPSFLRDPGKLTNKAKWRQHILLPHLVSFAGSGLQLWGLLMEDEPKPLSEAQSIGCPLPQAGGPQDQGHRMPSFKAGSFVKHSRSVPLTAASGHSHPDA